MKAAAWCRHTQDAGSPAAGSTSAQVPQLLQGLASPDTSHAARARRALGSAQGPLDVSDRQDRVQESKLDIQAVLLPEPPVSHRAPSASGDVHGRCVRCQRTAAQRQDKCRFHPALLKDPGPLLYSPEWHACRAAKHSADQPGCYVRQGHYFPASAVTGLSHTKSAAQVMRQSSPDCEQPQPRTQLPIPSSAHMEQHP